jgi:hypothetical protein
MQIDDLSKVLYMFKTIVNNGFFFFSNVIIPSINVHHSFSKLKRILTLMIIKGKTLEIGEIHFECIWIP